MVILLYIVITLLVLILISVSDSAAGIFAAIISLLFQLSTVIIVALIFGHKYIIT